ncbi:MAG: glutamate synthase subunit beta, partial [Acutalibacteraceae bacterium]
FSIIENGFKNNLIKPNIPARRTGKRVAIIGSGPSGLACADQLNHRGHEVTVFEKSDRAGGLLMYGIPNMKLDKKIVDRRISLMTEEGVTFKTGCDVGENCDAKEILRDFDAVVLCGGAGNARDLKVENRNTKGVYFAVDFLTANTKSLLDSNLKDNKFISAKDKNVVIVGGGDTGNDCVGTSIRHGCKSVIQIEMMPKLPDSRTENNQWPQWPRICKTDYGQEEAIYKFGNDPRIYQSTVKKLIPDEKGNLKEIVIVSLTPEKDEKTGRMIMKEIEGSEKKLDCDLLIIAAGFLGPMPYVLSSFGVEANERTNIKTKEGHYRTNVDKVFTAGDMHRGQSLVVWAIHEGREAAREVDEYLMGYTNML